jgi:signal transduction histidine kinase
LSLGQHKINNLGIHQFHPLPIKNIPSVNAVHEYLDSYLGEHISEIDKKKKNLTASLITENLKHKREEEIQAALERVRVVVMKMKDESELIEVIRLTYKELTALDLIMNRCLFMTYDTERKGFMWWMAADEAQLERGYFVQDNPFDPYQVYKDAWKKRLKRWSYTLEGSTKNEWDKYLFSQTEMRDAPAIVIKSMKAVKSIILSGTFSNFGCLNVTTFEPLTKEQEDLMVRFTNVFELAFTRFTDLKKAQAAIKEAQIEAALERVRARAMSMQNVNELSDVIGLVYHELSNLDLSMDRCLIITVDKARNGATWWMAEGGEKINRGYFVQDHNHEPHRKYMEGWAKRLPVWEYYLGGKVKQKWDQYLFAHTELRELPLPVIEYMKSVKQVYLTFSTSDFGFMNVATMQPLKPKEVDLLVRFAKVFELAYTRFNDIKKAEASAREAHIEAALERVRYRAMAMQTSDDVGDATVTMFNELTGLGIDTVRSGIAILHGEFMEVWTIGKNKEGDTVKGVGLIEVKLHPLWVYFRKNWSEHKTFTYYFLQGKDKNDYIRIISNIPGYQLSQKKIEFPDVHVQMYIFEEGGVFAFSRQAHSDQDKELMIRFTKVFGLTFRRYQDLKKAEAQAREATIQACLERIRGKAMAMHSTRDLADTIHSFYHELASLHLAPIRCGVGLINKEHHTADLSTMNTTTDGHSVEALGVIRLSGHKVLERVYENWTKQQDYYPVLRGNQIKEYYQVLKPQINFPEYPDDMVQYGYFFFFPEGGVYAWTEKEMHEDELNIYRRFTSVLSLTYKRHKDLKNAEDRAQLAVKEASLDRVRAEIASMRNTNDLQRITPLIWKELRTLNISFVRCGVFIMDDTDQKIQIFLSNPDGAAIAAFDLRYDTPGEYADIISHWRQKIPYANHWGINSFSDLADILVKRKVLKSRHQYLKTMPKDGIYLHFLPFNQGMLYVGNTSALEHSQLNLVQCVADAFATAYARYEDFIRLEEAKQQVEKTLRELKQAQQQLIHSEKMASLGELTAGIAHEIQNPLNFVNNFSEVNLELTDELDAALTKGKIDDIHIIAEDIRANQGRILEHGKRAEAIVRSMLMHSRNSTGQKEWTDVNSLVDEYVKLSYHGFRSREKDFNVPIFTELDANVGKLELVAQDVGRVILNLMNNSLYAVKERAVREGPKYKPEICVITRKVKKGVEIIVKDNGPGIPDSVRDKIFQPFFTTKPTGQGTGLGLSLSYDIITKGHGGDISIESNSKQGTSIIILLRS